MGSRDDRRQTVEENPPTVRGRTDRTSGFAPTSKGSIGHIGQDDDMCVKGGASVADIAKHAGRTLPPDPTPGTRSERASADGIRPPNQFPPAGNFG